MLKDLLMGRQQAFVNAWVRNEQLPVADRLPDYQVAIRAGVKPESASAWAAEALKLPKIIQGIEARKHEMAEFAEGRIDGVDCVRVIHEWMQIAIGDPTEIAKVRRLCCRYCWGDGFQYQHTNAEYAQGTARALELGDDLAEFSGGAGFDKLREPNAECPECAGEGVEDLHIADFRKLTPTQRRLIAGVKQGKYGVEIQWRDQDAALMNLAKWYGLVVNRNEVSGPNGGPIPTANVNYTLPTDPAEAARVYQLLMEGKKVG